jgi:hypothetical protein
MPEAIGITGIGPLDLSRALTLVMPATSGHYPIHTCPHFSGVIQELLKESIFPLKHFEKNGMPIFDNQLFQTSHNLIFFFFPSDTHNIKYLIIFKKLMQVFTLGKASGIKLYPTLKITFGCRKVPSQLLSCKYK